MAEGESTVVNLAPEPELKDKGDSLECAVCLQTCIHPAQLPCGHIFCFLCIKGIANQSKRCAMCRQEIPRDFIEHPNLLRADIVSEITTNYDGTYQWFYEGRNGWWQYDERTSRELEASYKAGERICELLIAGFLYVADLEAMLQIRRNDPSRRRRIKRDLANIPKKGIAGLRTESDVPNHEQGTQPSESANSNSGSAESSSGSYSLAMPPVSDREVSPHTDLQETIERISNLRLDDDSSIADDRRPQRRVRTFDV